MNENILLIKCFGKWWKHEQHHYSKPPRLPDDIAALAEIILHMPARRVLKNRHNEDISDALILKVWMGMPLPDLDDKSFRNAYIDYIENIPLYRNHIKEGIKRI